MLRAHLMERPLFAEVNTWLKNNFRQNQKDSSIS